jgi:predicted TIM-barrel fold metal-dependent hydrolase
MPAMAPRAGRNNPIMTDVIDVNAYIGDWPFRPLRQRTPAAVRCALERASFTRALVSPLAAIFRQECMSANSEMMRALRRAGEFFVPVPAVNPNYPGWQDDVQATVDTGAPGIRLFPNYHAYSLDDAAIREAVGRAVAAGLAIFISLRMQDERHHHPRMMVPAVPVEEVVALAQAMPQGRIVPCMARYAEAETLLAARPPRDVILSASEESCPRQTAPRHYPNGIFLDLSGVQGPVGCVELLAARYGAGRLLTGTAAPLQYPLPAVAKVHAAELDAADKERILGGNAAGLWAL